MAIVPVKERELVKIASNNPAHPKGYYTGFRDCMTPGDIEYIEDEVLEVKHDPVTEPIKLKKKRK